MEQKSVFSRISLLAICFVLTFADVSAEAVWKYKTGGRIYSTPLVTDSTIYFGGGDSILYALDKRTGKEKWRYKSGGAVHSSPALYRNFILFSSSDGLLHAIDMRNGMPVWRFRAEEEKMADLWDYYLSSPYVNDAYVYWCSGNGCVYAIHGGSGQLKWKFQTDDIVHATPVVHQNKLYVGSFDGNFYCLSVETGQLLWKFNTVGAKYFPKGAVQGSAVVDNNMVYLGSRDYNLYALDALEGFAHWNYRHPGGWFVASPLIQGDHLYAGTSDGHKFYCINKYNGEIVWQIDLNMRVYGQAAYFEGKVYFGTFAGEILGVDALTGNIQFKFTTEGHRQHYKTVFNEQGTFKPGFEIYGEDYLESEKKLHALGAILSSPVMDGDRMYFGSSDGYFYAVSLQE